jgi:chromosome transmission fidelity protein 18
MSSQDFSDCLTSFDPAVHLHSELIDEAHGGASYSDDIDALNVTKEEQRTEHIKNRTVIQHRAWTLPEIFRSEDSCVSGEYTCRHEANSILTIGRQPDTN